MQSFVLVLIVFAAREWREEEEEKSEVDSDAAAIRDKNGISEDKPEETIDKRYLILQDKLKKAYEQIEDLKEQLKRISSNKNKK